MYTMYIFPMCIFIFFSSNVLRAPHGTKDALRLPTRARAVGDMTPRKVIRSGLERRTWAALGEKRCYVCVCVRAYVRGTSVRAQKKCA